MAEDVEDSTVGAGEVVGVEEEGVAGHSVALEEGGAEEGSRRLWIF